MRLNGSEPGHLLIRRKCVKRVKRRWRRGTNWSGESCGGAEGALRGGGGMCLICRVARWRDGGRRRQGGEALTLRVVTSPARPFATEVRDPHVGAGGGPDPSCWPPACHKAHRSESRPWVSDNTANLHLNICLGAPSAARTHTRWKPKADGHNVRSLRLPSSPGVSVTPRKRST